MPLMCWRSGSPAPGWADAFAITCSGWTLGFESHEQKSAARRHFPVALIRARPARLISLSSRGRLSRGQNRQRARTERMLQAKLMAKSLLIPLVTLCGCAVVIGQGL